jgi:hypothetical protein
MSATLAAMLLCFASSRTTLLCSIRFARNSGSVSWWAIYGSQHRKHSDPCCQIKDRSAAHIPRWPSGQAGMPGSWLRWLTAPDLMPYCLW